MFTIEDSTRSLTVHREDRGWLVTSNLDGARVHASGLTREAALGLAVRLNRISELVPRSSPALVYAFATGTAMELADVLTEELISIGGESNAPARAEHAKARREFAYCSFSVARLGLSGFEAVETPADQVQRAAG